ncbi:MAG: NADH-quinone oxidoreductase subunit L [Deltaproteobacteria bacterium]|nr:NADH-quinone oxidoreductase subunit L [Deltaproteobacteria bacterium]MBI2182131.1 NADH-quinone oxidoreductase subunit L [Deltaproteobacteria bacterium]MBI2230874.1 NADH-quinone oxidoreductase subunit L [Deltaproteobacteria bacterium]MBI2365121.1 NADH-quinone oxidoreductase subunit L [Deltaproteobacteria bacterium]MBI2532594.1 NADH-quinone oxidoreductase subunit L [Deltaproteobacteria bacterium]
METPIQTDFLRWIVFLPLLGAIVNGLVGAKIQKSMGKGAISFLACAPVIVAFGLSVQALMTLQGLAPEQRFLIDRLYTWIDLGSLKVEMAFLVDPLSTVMILVVTGVGGLIHIYATGYMHEDKAFWRFFAYLNLFTAAMLTLVLGDSLLLLFVGWEGVGFCSYALIGFWYQDHNNARAGNKAFIVNRVGDFGFVLGMFLLFWSLDAQGHGTLTVREMVKWAPAIEAQTLWGIPVITLATLFLFIGATGKSAQIPLHVWLPDAMAGPTPVSALIHAATMVTAGVYMTARMNVFFSMAPLTLNLIAWIGVATALLAATIALTQYDIKKVLAYSTVSQLGYMFIGVGVGGYAAAIFHLMTHAFFKACLFLGAGSVIHAMHHEQDMRKMGGLKAHMPLTTVTFFISVLAIAGFPPFAGFFSKDEILWLAYTNPHVSKFVWLLALVGAGLTAFYMFRQLFMVFFGERRADHHTQGHVHESPSVMTYPLIVLALGALFAGFIGLPGVLGGSQFAHWLEPVIHAHEQAHGSHALEWSLMGFSVLVATFGFFIAYLMYYRGALSPQRFCDLGRGFFYRLFDGKYYLDEIYQVIFVNGTLLLARIGALFDQYVIDGIVDGSASLTRFTSWLNGLFDNYIIDGIVNAIANLTFWSGNKFRRVQTGNINGYLYGILIAVVLAIIVKLRYWS